MINYPKTKKVKDEYTLHGKTISDNYSWMEKNSEELENWIKQQNELSKDFLEKSSKKEQLKKRIYEIADYEKKNSYFEVNDHLFFFKNSGLENQYVLYVKYKGSEEEEIFLDPNTFTEDGTSTLSSISFSKDGKYCAYGISKAGADWTEVKVIKVETKEILKDSIVGIKFDSDAFCYGVAWYKDGFYYPNHTNNKTNFDYTSKDKPCKIYYHKLGNSQQDNELIFEKPEAENLIIGANVDESETKLVMLTSTGCIGNDAFIAELENSPKPSEFKQIIQNYDSKFEYLGHHENKLYYLTNFNAINRKIVIYNISTNSFEDVISEGETSIESAKLLGGKILVEKLEDVQSKVYFYSLQGNLLKEIPMPDLGTFLGCSGKLNSKFGYFSVSSFLSPLKLYKMNLENFEYDLIEYSKVNFDFENYKVEQKFATSKDGTKIPMFIISKKDLEFTSKNPTILYGYGGFNYSILPTFSAKILTWIELGGVFVMANLRGGGEYGEAWHEAGKKLNKQNVFDDAYGCAEYLIENNYTSAKNIAIQGGSNGGLLAATCALQRPDLFAVSLPAAAVLDMLKFHEFTCGYQWCDEYGYVNNKDEFENFLTYSPYHIIKEGVKYPSFFVTCSDLDDRVVPAHSYKFIARLQDSGILENPLFIKS